jgi:transcription antitermination factor NusA-like protein
MPGVKTKIIVASDDEDVDPAGCLIGPKGMRVRTIVDELFGEKIDILNYTTNQKEMVRRALVPGIVEEIEIDEATTTIQSNRERWRESERSLVVEEPISISQGISSDIVFLLQLFHQWKVLLQVLKLNENNQFIQ